MGCTALHWAADVGMPGVIDVLVEAGANVEDRSGDVTCTNAGCEYKGFTSLHCAAFSNAVVENMAELLDKGADSTPKTATASRPFM